MGVVVVVWVCCILAVLSIVDGKACRPGTKQSKNSARRGCESLSTIDVFSSMHWLANPPAATCNNVVNIQNLPVCEDSLKLPSQVNRGTAVSPVSDSPYKSCFVLSLMTTVGCEDLGSLIFEKHWSRYCTVVIHHMIVHPKKCNLATTGDRIVDYPNIQIIRHAVWGSQCFNCVYKFITASSIPEEVDILKLQGMSSGMPDPMDGVQYTVLADVYLHLPWLISRINQVIMTTSFSVTALIDNVGRESEHAWNMWAARKVLGSFGTFSTTLESGPYELRPLQFDHLLDRLGFSTNVSYYHHSFMRISDSAQLRLNKQKYINWRPRQVPPLKAVVPKYCKTPQSEEDAVMQQWVVEELNVRCHPFFLAVPCDFDRLYEPFIPCQQELMNNLAEDYAASKGWCDFTSPESVIPALKIVDAGASTAFRSKPRFAPGKGVRLAFMMTVYSDAPYVTRLLSRLYSPEHYYLLHVDPAGSKPEFTAIMREEIKNKYAVHNNVFLSHDVPIVYGASTATIVLSKSMAWFLREASGWDYFVCVTGSDYPLIPIHRLEKILLFQQPPRPFVMAWTPGTSTHIFRLQKTHPVFEENKLLLDSVTAVTKERGNPLGAMPMEYRSNNFGPPLFCNGQKSFYLLTNRRNKSATRFDTQWLFPRDVFPRRGRAIAEESPQHTTPAMDGLWRVWKKSDPATTAIYDRESVEYIVNSEEGRKYWHFFKHMLLGSEEHYYVSLLYNWPRTRSFVQTLSAEMVWNTWKEGLAESSGGFQTHTNFLTLKEWDWLQGFSLRGLMFARKFSTKKNPEVLDKIDQLVHFNASTEAGLYWPGFFETDIWTPGKDWVAAHRRNETLRKQRQKMAKERVVNALV